MCVHSSTLTEVTCSNCRGSEKLGTGSSGHETHGGRRYQTQGQFRQRVQRPPRKENDGLNRSGSIETLYKDLCRKAFHISPFRAKVRFKKLKKLLASAKYLEGPAGEMLGGLKIKVLRKLQFSNALVAQCLIHEIAHVVSKQAKHNDKFYRVYFQAAETKFGRRFF